MHAFISFSCRWVSVVPGGREDMRIKLRKLKLNESGSSLANGGRHLLPVFWRDGARAVR